MATVTLVIGNVADTSGEARLEIDIDDTTDPLNRNVLRGRVVNQMSRAVFVDVRRGNGASFWTVSVPAGQTIERATGGPVRTESDMPFMMLRTT